MKRFPVWVLMALAIAPLCPLQAQSEEALTREIVQQERRTLDGWQRGDPAPALAALDPGVTYFHVMTDKQLTGTPAVQALYERYRGRPLFDSYEMENALVQGAGDVAVLTYILVQHNGDATTRWNATQVYRRTAQGWRVLHSHFSQNRPALAPPAK